jgi:hydroxymethylpyrimidine pyrophosphatase-like HAD family hydrolase
VVELNGAFITDWRTRAPLVCHSLEPAVAAATLDWALASDIHPFVSSFAGGRQHLYPPLVLSNAGIAWYDASRRAARDVRLRGACDPRRVLDQQIVCLTLIAQRERLLPIASELAAAFPAGASTLLYENPYQPGWCWLTVQAPHATKAHALRALAEGAAVELADATVFGDEINDVPMFELAGHAVAVDNAIAELKRVAHQIIGPHHEDSVVRYLLDRAAR